MANWSYSGAYFGTLSCSGSISDKDSSGNATFSGTMTYTPSSYLAKSSVYITNARISFDLNGTYVRAQTTFPYGTGTRSRSVSCTISFGSPSSSSSITGYGVLFDGYDVSTGSHYSGVSTGGGQTLTAGAYIDPTPSMYPPTLSISPTTQFMGQSITISESGGQGYSVSSRRITINGTNVGSYTIGNWTIPLSTFEPLCTSANQLTAVFQTRCTAASGYEGSGNSNTVSVTMKVPANYLPTATHTYEFINPQNSSLVAGYSSLKVTLEPGLLPEENSATITSAVLQSVTSTNSAITTASFTKSGNDYTSGVLPAMSGVPSYTFSLTFRITDSRGNICDYTTNTFRVTNFIPPYCYITNLKRDTATTGTLNVSIDSPSAAYLATVKVGNGAVVDVMSRLVSTQTGYTLEYPITGLSSGTQYNVVFSYQDTNMNTYGENPYSYTQLLSTLAMPLSLYDDGSIMAASFGEECADNYGQDCVINFAKDAYLRYVKADSTVVIDKPCNLFSTCPYNVGDIYITTLSSNPSTIWSGTTWTQLKDRFLLGAGDAYNAGATGGEATHTLTVQEMPSHSHTYTRTYTGEEATRDYELHTVCSNSWGDYTTSAVGGGQAHNNMPPYLVVYMWQRTA